MRSILTTLPEPRASALESRHHDPVRARHHADRDLRDPRRDATAPARTLITVRRGAAQRIRARRRAHDRPRIGRCRSITSGVVTTSRSSPRRSAPSTPKSSSRSTTSTRSSVRSPTSADSASEWSEWTRPHEAQFRLLAVDPAARRQGAGDALVRACINRAGRDEQPILIHTTPWMIGAQRIYRATASRGHPSATCPTTNGTATEISCSPTNGSANPSSRTAGRLPPDSPAAVEGRRQHSRVNPFPQRERVDPRIAIADT